MSINFGDNLDKSFAYANGVFKTFSNWFILIVLYTLVIGSAIAVLAGVMMMMFGYLFIADPSVAADPVMSSFGVLLLPSSIALMIIGSVIALIFGFFVSGVTLRVYRGGELSLSSPGKMFVEGLLSAVIMFIYMIPYTLVSILTMFGPINNMAYLIIVGIIIPVIIYIATVLIAIFAVIRFAKTGKFGAAFDMKEICHIISNFGWLRYLGNLILFNLIVGIIVSIIFIIPIIGLILGIVVTPFVAVMTARFYANMYESAEE